MRAYRLPQPTGIDALIQVEEDRPKPGPRQVLVKVAACSLNFRDLAIALGSYRMASKLEAAQHFGKVVIRVG